MRSFSGTADSRFKEPGFITVECRLSSLFIHAAGRSLGPENGGRSLGNAHPLRNVFHVEYGSGEHGRDGLMKNAIESGKAILAVSPLPELCRR